MNNEPSMDKYPPKKVWEDMSQPEGYRDSVSVRETPDGIGIVMSTGGRVATRPIRSWVDLAWKEIGGDMTQKTASESGNERMVRIILEDFHGRICTVIKNTVDHEQRFNEAFDLLANDVLQLLNDQPSSLQTRLREAELALEGFKVLAGMGGPVKPVEVLKAVETRLREVEAYKAIAYLDAKTLRDLSHRQEDKIATLESTNQQLMVENERLTRQNEWLMNQPENAMKARCVGLQAELEAVRKERDELKFQLMQSEAGASIRIDQRDREKFQSDIYAKQVELKEELIKEQSEKLSRLTTANLELVEREQTLQKALEKISTEHHDYCDYWKWQSLTNCKCPSFTARQALLTPPSELGKRVEKVIAEVRKHKEVWADDWELVLNKNDIKPLFDALAHLDALSGGTK